MKANQESLMKDRRGKSDVGVILIIIAIAFVVVACGLILLFVATPHLLGFQHSIGSQRILNCLLRQILSHLLAAGFS